MKNKASVLGRIIHRFVPEEVLKLKRMGKHHRERIKECGIRRV